MTRKLSDRKPSKNIAARSYSVWLPLPVPPKLTRIFSDVHFGDRSSRVLDLAQIGPLFAQTDRVVLNGDTLDTRPGPNPAHTAECRAKLARFVGAANAPATFLTGNHDPDISTEHWLELAGSEVLVVHGDVLFDEIVPWGRDAARIRRYITAALGQHASPHRLSLAERFAIWRSAAVAIPQRHQSERHPLKYAWHFAADTLWPPTRVLRVLRAWRAEPALAAQLARAHYPNARFILLGHTHRPAIRRVPNGPVVINTGSFSHPFGGYAVDVEAKRLCVRRIQVRGRDFHPGRLVAEFPLATG
jgi:UDP-2,3-diacylglucosamine pyrophosphatase LpxH